MTENADAHALAHPEPHPDHGPEPEVPGPLARTATGLTFAGINRDGTRLALVDDRGSEFTLDVTPGLRAALRGQSPRLGPLEKKMDSALRPRDIQTRIRAGETAESVAEAAGTSIEKIMPFVAPVLAERQHVAERAQRSNVRRPAGGETGARTLGDAVALHLRSRNTDPDEVVWDAWRREDGRWTLTATFLTDPRSGEGHFTFDAPGNYVVLDDDDARWLVGETLPETPAARDDLRSARARRLAAVSPDDETLPLGDDAIDLVAEPAPEATADPAPEPAAEPVAEQTMPLEAFLPDDEPEPQLPEAPAEEPAERAETAETAVEEEPAKPEEPAAEEKPAPRRPAKRRGRASVPSWDEIMFGGGDQ